MFLLYFCITYFPIALWLLASDSGFQSSLIEARGVHSLACGAAKCSKSNNLYFAPCNNSFNFWWPRCKAWWIWWVSCSANSLRDGADFGNMQPSFSSVDFLAFGLILFVRSIFEDSWECRDWQCYQDVSNGSLSSLPFGFNSEPVSSGYFWCPNLMPRAMNYGHLNRKS